MLNDKIKKKINKKRTKKTLVNPRLGINNYDIEG
jgi:hypothetical protein